MPFKGFQDMAASTQPPATKHGVESLKLEVMEQRNRLIHVERTVNSLGESMTGLDAKLDTVVTALTGITTRQELSKPTDWLKLIGAAVGAVSLFTAGVGGISYIVRALGESEKVAVRKDLDFLQMRLERGWGIGGTNMQMRVREGAAQ